MKNESNYFYETHVHINQGVSWKTKVKSVFGIVGKCCFYLQYFLYNIDNYKSKQKHTQSHSSYKLNRNSQS